MLCERDAYAQNSVWKPSPIASSTNIFFPINPTTATSTGIHKYDGQLEDYSKAGVAKRTARTQSNWEAQFAKLPQSDDRDLVLNYIRASLLELETIREWEKNPDNYSSGITSSAFTIMSRKFAPPEARLESLIDRERHMPKVLPDARANLNNPPRIYTEIAIEQLPGNIDFFQERCSAGVQGRQRPEASRGFQDRQSTPSSPRCSNTKPFSRRICSRAPTAISGWERTISRRSCCTRRWWTFLSTACSKSATRICTRTSRKFRETAAKIDPGKTPQADSGRTGEGSSRAR